MRIMYAHFIQKDLPDTVVDFDADATLRNVPPIIAGNNNSVVIGAGNTRIVSFSGLGPGTEGKPFSVETWLVPLSSAEVYAFDHTNASIKWSDGIHFTVRVNGADVSLIYRPAVRKAFHVIGTYNGQGIALIVDGVLVDSLQFENPTTTVWTVDEDVTIGTGTGTAVVDGVAFYTRELSVAVANDHYLLGTTIPPITSNLSGLSATILNFETQDKFLITRAEWPDWELGSLTNVEIDDGSLYSAPGGTWHGFIPMPNYDVIQKARVSWEGSAAVSTSIDGGATWQNIASNPGFIPSISGTSPMTVDIRATLAAGATLEHLTVELYDSLKYDMGLNEATAVYQTANLVNATAAHDQLEYREDRGMKTSNGGLVVTYDPAVETESIYAIDAWVKLDSIAQGTIFSVSGGAGSNVGPGSKSAADTLYLNGLPAASATLVVGEWIHVLMRLAVPRVGNVSVADQLVGTIGNITIFKEDVAGQEQRIYRSYFGGQRLDLSDDAGLVIAEGGWDLYSYDWTAVGS